MFIRLDKNNLKICRTDLGMKIPVTTKSSCVKTISKMNSVPRYIVYLCGVSDAHRRSFQRRMDFKRPLKNMIIEEVRLISRSPGNLLRFNRYRGYSCRQENNFFHY